MSETPITFPHGLVGCDSWKRFVLVEDPGEPVQQLVCVDQPGISFLVATAEGLDPNYAVELTDADAEALEYRDGTRVQVLCTLTLNPEPPMVTANLLGPLVINRERGLGKQVVLVSSGYALKHPVVERLPEAAHADPH